MFWWTVLKRIPLRLTSFRWNFHLKWYSAWNFLHDLDKIFAISKNYNRIKPSFQAETSLYREWSCWKAKFTMQSEVGSECGRCTKFIEDMWISEYTSVGSWITSFDRKVISPVHVDIIMVDVYDTTYNNVRARLSVWFILLYLV